MYLDIGRQLHSLRGISGENQEARHGRGLRHPSQHTRQDLPDGSLGLGKDM